MAAYKDAICIAAEHRRVLINPRDGTPNLVGHWHEIAARILHVDEVHNDRVRACTDKYFGWKPIADRPSKPRATMDENVDGCVWTVRRIDVHTLDSRGAIFVPARLPQPL